MREKYVEERFPRYFKFGYSKEGKVDVASAHNDCICTVTEEEANALIADRDKVVDMLVQLSIALDIENTELFDKLWYS